ncbi:MAG: HAMP domain-containing histidine kinase, partial [Alteromonadaceae bacterium]|nr:HAMP domain-containing histidine kinase [Alteromonadaceae bacterium]
KLIVAGFNVFSLDFLFQLLPRMIGAPLTYPLVWLAWRSYAFWCQSIMQLSTYTQVLKEGEQNLHYRKQHPDNLLLGLLNEIKSLATTGTNQKAKNQTLDHLLSKILDSWPIPVCLFDQELKLTYRNTAMNEQLQQPMLLDSSSDNLGFTFEKDHFSHTKFSKKWQCQTIKYLHLDQRHWLFSALDISQLLNQNQRTTQQSLIRVLAHELRNSLTPMSSMADTLLSNEHLDEQQTRLVLSRIKQRSNRLLSFINEYSKLAQLPNPKLAWFNFNEALNEAKSMGDQTNCSITFHGNEQCFGDIEQIVQVMINLLKNANEACEQPQTLIEIKAYFQQNNQQSRQQNHQVIEVVDNGPGFANLNNVLTPFYTTKKHGSGIGLSLCAEIARNHGGQLKVENLSDQGAKITMNWPILKPV